MKRIAQFPIQLYRWFLSPYLGRHCRFEPSCSSYALEAIEKHGVFGGYGLAARRVCRCHPWGKAGYDPVPEKASHA